jgi:phosphoglycolate phosphatase
LCNRAITDNGKVTDRIAAGADPPADPDIARRRASSPGGPQLVIFDLDGTITDSAEGIVARW